MPSINASIDAATRPIVLNRCVLVVMMAIFSVFSLTKALPTVTGYFLQYFKPDVVYDIDAAFKDGLERGVASDWSTALMIPILGAAFAADKAYMFASGFYFALGIGRLVVLLTQTDALDDATACEVFHGISRDFMKQTVFCFIGVKCLIWVVQRRRAANAAAAEEEADEKPLSEKAMSDPIEV